MEQVSIIGIDLAKTALGRTARADGPVVFRRKHSRDRVLPFLGSQATCTVAMEACGPAPFSAASRRAVVLSCFLHRWTRPVCAIPTSGSGTVSGAKPA